jgi:RES domain-containing protein
LNGGLAAGEASEVHVWRIAYSGALNLASLGFGSTLGDGRWHQCLHGGAPQSPQIVYAASSRALCQLEKRVHCNGFAPKNMALMRLELPATAVCLNSENLGLPPDWRAQQARTQQLGMHWLASKASLGLWVPSFVEPAERNLLINPAHPNYAKIKLVIEKNPFVFDPRLF